MTRKTKALSAVLAVAGVLAREGWNARTIAGLQEKLETERARGDAYRAVVLLSMSADAQTRPEDPRARLPPRPRCWAFPDRSAGGARPHLMCVKCEDGQIRCE